MGTTAVGLVVAVLATWRVTHLLQAEDGPFDIIVRIRRAAGDGFWGSLLDCFQCLSLWVAAPFAMLAGPTWIERGMLWFALSGGACLLERIHPSAPAAFYVEDKEQGDGLLRQETSDGGPTPEPPSGAAPDRPLTPEAGGRGASSRSGSPSDPGEGGGA